VAFIAVVGCGPVGGALAHTLARRDRVDEIRLIDPFGGMAQGKALDILQSSPVEQFSARVIAAHARHSAAGAAAIVIADSGETGAEHTGEGGLALVREIVAFESAAPLVFAGGTQRELIGRVVAELHVPRFRVLGSAPEALKSALRALAGVAMDGSGVDVQLQVVGAPPAHAVVGWEEATASGVPLRTRLAPHVLAALAARIPTLWPPGPFALASAAARVVEAIVDGGRRPFSCFAALDAGSARNAVAAVPVDVGRTGIVHVHEPALTRQEQTHFETAVQNGGRA
jgi:malate dehydrogenase